MTPRINPFDPVYQAANSGEPAEKLKALPDFPRFIDLELTNTCNFRCLMCPTGTHAQTRKKGFMSDETFHRLLDGVRTRKTPLRFIRWGEPTLHKNLVAYLTAAHEAGVLTHLNTNGSHLDEPLTRALCSGILDCIKFSFQGVDVPSYSQMRNTDFFEQLLIRIERMAAMRGDAAKPFIQVSTTITYESAEQVAAFRERITPFADLVSVGRTILEHLEMEKMKCSTRDKETLARMKNDETVVKKHKKCPEVFDKLSVNWDGTVSACCADYDNQMVIGDLGADSLEKIWRSAQLNHYRTRLAQMRHGEFPLCRTCYDYMGLETPGLQGV